MSLVKEAIALNCFPKYFWIYVLQCEGDRYYVGITGHIQSRLSQHFEGNGSQFTQRYKPLHVVEKECIVYWASTFNGKPYEEENKKTEQYMNLYGKDKVCGGKYCITFFRNKIEHII